MEYHSILYPGQQQEQAAQDCPWISFSQAAPKGPVYVMRGNKMVLAPKGEVQSQPKWPSFFLDLNLDQVMEAMGVRAETEAGKAMMFPLPDISSIRYRQEIFRDLQKSELYDTVCAFRTGMGEALRLLKHAGETNYPAQSSRYVLDAADAYIGAVDGFAKGLEGCEATSESLLALGRHLLKITQSREYVQLRADTVHVMELMDSVRYQVSIISGCIEVRFPGEADDYAQSLRAALSAGGGQDEEAAEAITAFRGTGMCLLEKKLMAVIRQRYQKPFESCGRFAAMHPDPIDPGLKKFAEEVSFYIRYIDLMTSLGARGFRFTYPFVGEDERLSLAGIYDLALAVRSSDASMVVPNDLCLRDDESGACITGANQGGKTTFLRAMGQAAFLASLGMPVAAQSAQVPLFQRFFTHFSREEEKGTANGRLRQELLALKHLLCWAGKGSLYMLNEMFSSTSARDACGMTVRVISRAVESGAEVLCVTHVPEAAAACERMASLVAQVDCAQGNARTYRIIRQAADGLAWARDLMYKYRLDRAVLKERIEHGN